MPKRVLIVDDHKLILDLLSAYIERKSDMEVTCVTSRAKAFSALEQTGPFDAVLVDLRMPPRVGQTLIAIDPSADDGYLARVADLLNAIEGTPGARLPGARRLAAIQIARDEGICVPTLYVEQARELAGS